ncbi:hypothetical protein GQ44DRAFT_807288 [Phaeosphaeriaceae sp. PMI808]|nr:hypothetical protein GQ44DRAFT_807288 [Phaeosphaeriaceae sp. PMI808]
MAPNSRDSTSPLRAPTNQQQNDYIVRMYNKIKAVTKQISTDVAPLRNSRDALIREIDSLPISTAQKLILRNEAPVFKKSEKILPVYTAHVLLLETFEEDFRKEWKQIKTKGCAERQVFLDKKSLELRHMCDKHRAEIKDIFEELDMLDLESEDADLGNEVGETVADGNKDD